MVKNNKRKASLLAVPPRRVFHLPALTLTYSLPLYGLPRRLIQHVLCKECQRSFSDLWIAMKELHINLKEHRPQIGRKLKLILRPEAYFLCFFQWKLLYVSFIYFELVTLEANC